MVTTAIKRQQVYSPYMFLVEGVSLFSKNCRWALSSWMKFSSPVLIQPLPSNQPSSWVPSPTEALQGSCPPGQKSRDLPKALALTLGSSHPACSKLLPTPQDLADTGSPTPASPTDYHHPLKVRSIHFTPHSGSVLQLLSAFL